jgi:catechol 2,3-dioxygenase-like lactoylglutathione lyase family enzyme
MNNVLKRTTLIVRDAERSLAFYRDVLGMTVWYDDEIVLSGHGLAAGRPGNRTRLVIMQAQDSVIGMLGLLQFIAPPLAAPAAERQHLAIGDADGHLVRMTSPSFWDPDGYFFEVNQRLAA